MGRIGWHGMGYCRIGVEAWHIGRLQGRLGE